MARVWDDGAVKWIVDKLKALETAFNGFHATTYLVRQTLSSANSDMPLAMSAKTASDTTDSADDIVYRNNSIYGNPSTGKLTATGFTFSGKAEIQYDDSNKCLNFVFK